MAKSRRKRTPKTVLKLPDLEQSKSAVLNSLTSASSKRSYEHAIESLSSGIAQSLGCLQQDCSFAIQNRTNNIRMMPRRQLEIGGDTLAGV